MGLLLIIDVTSVLLQLQLGVMGISYRLYFINMVHSSDLVNYTN